MFLFRFYQGFYCKVANFSHHFHGHRLASHFVFAQKYKQFLAFSRATTLLSVVGSNERNGKNGIETGLKHEVLLEDGGFEARSRRVGQKPEPEVS
jgi:hypothetical protein